MHQELLHVAPMRLVRRRTQLQRNGPHQRPVAPAAQQDALAARHVGSRAPPKRPSHVRAQRRQIRHARPGIDAGDQDFRQSPLRRGRSGRVQHLNPIHRLGVAEFQRVREVLQHADRSTAHIVTLLIEAVRALEAGVAPQHQAGRARRAHMRLRLVQQAMRQPNATPGQQHVEPANLPNTAAQRCDGDHADNAPIRLRRPQPAALARIVARQCVQFRQFGVDVEHDAGILAPAGADQRDEARGIGVAAGSDRDCWCVHPRIGSNFTQSCWTRFSTKARARPSGMAGRGCGPVPVSN